MTRDDLFGINVGIAKGLFEACESYVPENDVSDCEHVYSWFLPCVGTIRSWVSTIARMLVSRLSTSSGPTSSPPI